MSADEPGLDRAVVDRLESYVDKRDLAAVWVARSNSFAWLTGGDNAVDRGTEPGVAAAGYDGDGVRVVTDSVEAGRLADEQLPEGVAVSSFPWHKTTLAEYLAAESPQPAAADVPVEGFDRVDTTALRQPLTGADVDRYRTLGEAVAGAVEGVCRDCSSNDTERAVAADLRGRLAADGVDAPVALVGGQRRTQQYRHYTPTDERLGSHALVSVTATRAGLYASCTRTVAFDPPQWLSDRHRAAARVEVSALAATRAVGLASGSAGDVFDSVQSAYAGVGEAGEWRQHHQGGAAGYAGREWVARPDSEATVRLPMAYAWNPTVRGAKSEGTVLVAGDRVEPLTTTGEWPTVEASAVDADLTVDRPAVLEQ